ncbi:MAG: hypothetical protein R2838_12705 [Caldilineaceae bacterium]
MHSTWVYSWSWCCLRRPEVHPCLCGGTWTGRDDPDQRDDALYPLDLQLLSRLAQTAFGTQMYGYSGFDLPEWGVERKRRNLDPAMNWPGAVSNRKTQRRRTITGTPWRVRWLHRDGNFNILLTLNFAPEWAAESTNGPIYADNLMTSPNTWARWSSD